MENPFSAALEAQQDIAVVVELTAVDEGGDVGGEFGDVQAGDVFGEVFGVGADVTDAAGGAAFGRIRAPRGLFLTAFFESGSQPSLWVFDDDLADFS